MKKGLTLVLCVMFVVALLCGCDNDKSSENRSDNAAIDKTEITECSKEEYVARITAYKEYYEEIENDYYTVNGAILVHEDGRPYMVLCCIMEQDADNYKIQLIDYKDGKTVLNGEKEFYGEDRNYDIELAFLDDRCIMKVEIDAGESGYPTEYWEFKQNNLIAQKLSEDEVTEFVEDIRRYGYVYDISEKPYEYLYTYEKGKLIGHNHDVDYGTTKIFDRKISIYDKESDIATVNKIAAQKLYEYMQLSDEQKEYFVYPKTNEDGDEILIADIANIYSCEVLMPLSYHRWMNGVSFKQCLNELINEPIYRIEDLMIKELNFDWYNKYSEDMSQIAVERKAEELKAIEERMPKYNPYSSDEELLEVYYSYVKNTLDDWYASESCYKCKDTDLATIMTMDNDFAKVLKTYLETDYVFTSNEFKGATWKDIVYNGGSSYPTLTVSKNGNTLTVPIVNTNSDNAQNSSDNSEVLSAYEKYISEKLGPNEYSVYNLIYIDDDDVPELLYDNTADGRGTELLYYQNGEILSNPAPCRMFDFYYIPRGNKVCYVSYWEGDEYGTVAYLDNGTLISEHTYASGYNMDTDAYVYSIDDVECTEGDYNSFNDSYLKDMVYGWDTYSSIQEAYDNIGNSAVSESTQ